LEISCCVALLDELPLQPVADLLHFLQLLGKYLFLLVVGVRPFEFSIHIGALLAKNRQFMTQIAVFVLHLAIEAVKHRYFLVFLLEFAFDDLQFLRVCEGVLRFDYLLELVAQTNALIHQHFDFDLGFMSACILQISF